MWIAIIAVCGCYPFLTLLTGIHKCGSHFRESVDHLEALEQYFSMLLFIMLHTGF